MITTRKRLLSLLLAITMVITLLPHVSFAAEKEQKQGTEVTTDASKDKNDSKDTKEQKDPVKGLEEGQTDKPVGPDAEIMVTDQEIIDEANKLFIPGGENYMQMIRIDHVSESPGNVMRAGETLSYDVSITLMPVPYYWDSSGEPHYYFQQYENTAFTITLPAGLLLTGSLPDGGVWSEEGDSISDRDITVPHTYIILPNGGNPIPSGQTNITFTLNVYVGNNGTEDSITTHFLPEDMVKATTKFYLTDENEGLVHDTNGNPVFYEQNDIEAPDDIETMSPDEWTVNKTALDPKVDIDNKKVTFYYDIEVGLKSVGNEAEGSNWTVDAWYGRTGRTWLQTASLTDSFDTELIIPGEDNENVTLKFSSVTIERYDTYGNYPTFGPTVHPLEPSDDLTSAEFTVQIWNGEKNPNTGTSLDDLVMNSGILVITNSTSVPNQLTPKYTKYRMAVTYSIPDDWIAKFPLMEGYDLDEINDVTLTVEMADKSQDPETAQANAHADLPFLDPAVLKITKAYTDWQGNENDYGEQYGKIYYKISTTDGSEFTVYKNTGTDAAPVYEAIADKNGNTSYTELTGLEASNPNTNTLHLYYLTPGIEYKVEEDLTPEQDHVMDQTDDPPYFIETPEPKKPEDDPWTVRFHNIETVGQILIKKVDDAYRDMEDPSQKAGFILLYDNEGTPGAQVPGTGEQWTDANGEARFIRVPYGKYFIHEKDTPDGYVASPDIPVEVTREESIVELQIVNTQKDSRIILHKYIATTQADNDAANAPANFGTFTLQRSIDKNTWEDVFTNLTTVTGGTITKDVPAFDDNGNPYWYRFKETIPAGYYNPLDGATDVAYSEPVQLVVADEEGHLHAIPKMEVDEVPMYNRPFLKIHLNKTFYKVGNDGKTTTTENRSTKVSLWKTYDYVTLYRVYGTNETEEGQTVSQNDYADWTGLPFYENVNDEMVRVYYLIKEEAVYGYLLDIFGKYENQSGVTEWATHVIDNVTYLEVPMESTDGTETMTIWNRQNAIPVVIWKKNYYSNAPLPSTVKVTIWRVKDDGTVGDIAKNAIVEGEIYEEVLITTPTTYSRFYLEPGYKYVFQEVVNNSGLGFHSYVEGNASTGALAQEEIGGAIYGVIDLRGVSQTYDNQSDPKDVVRTINNAPEPNIRINKVDAIDENVTLNAKFKVYTYNETTGKYDPYPDAANQYEISTTNANSGVRLPEGQTFYFAESEKPDGYINPNIESHFNKFFDNFGDEYVWGQDSSDNSYKTFFKHVVHGEKVGNDVVSAFTFRDVKNEGAMRVRKYVDGKPANGFTIVIKKGDEVVATGITSGSGDNVGYVTFYHLPVYDEEGNLITYTVTEDLGDTADTYLQVSEDQSAQLDIGTVDGNGNITPVVVTVDTTNHELRVDNTRRISFTGRKVFRKTFEYGYTQYEESVAGAMIGLFVENENGDWVLVPTSELTDGGTNPRPSGETGAVTFSGLIRGRNYVMVEMSAGNDYMFPWNGSFLQFPPEGTVIIPGDQLSRYNYISLSGAMTSAEENLNVDHFPDGEPDRLINANHWVQFHVTKWVDPRPEPVGADVVHDQYPTEEGLLEDGTQLTPVDNVVFKLYRYIMPDGMTNVVFPKDYVEGEGWDEIGTYTTGTLYENDIRQSGEFISDSDQNINNHYVYLLVEVNKGPNSIEMNPNFRYTFWHAEGTNYTVTIDNNGDGTPDYTARDLEYQIDHVNHTDVLNYSPEGPGGTLYYLASVRIAKYQDSYNEENGDRNEDYQPLPGASFELSLAKDGTVIDVLTVGLDTQYSTIDNPLALAQSGTFQLLFNETDGEGVTHPYALDDFAHEKIYYLDNDDVEQFTFTYDGREFSGYRILLHLKEIYVPDGYMSTIDTLDMWLCFVNVVKPNNEGNYYGESWVFNDAYFVLTTGKNTTETLAEDQSATSWYVTNAASKDYTVDIGDTENPAKLRIVNYPSTNTAVTLVKYGYAPNEDTEGLLASELDRKTKEEISREPLGDIRMVIQKWDETLNKWIYWDYRADYGDENTTKTAATFTTREDGTYKFEHGLPQGVYRIWEESGNNDYENAYPYTSSIDRSRVFEVTKALKHLTFYNPKKAALKFVKKDAEGNVLTNVSFTVKKGNTTIGTANSGNNFTITGIETGKYTLTETVAGYSVAYLTKYLTEHYPAFKNFATSGTDIGYTYGKLHEETNADGLVTEREYGVSTIKPSASSVTDPMLFELVIEDPKLADVTLKKVDDRTGETIQGATFIVYFLPFSKLSGDISVNVPQAQEASGSYTATQMTNTAFLNAGWVRVGGANKTWTTDANGILTVKFELDQAGNEKSNPSKAEPGIYAFYETGAPREYEITKDTDGKVIIYTAVATGGLPVNVTLNPVEAEIQTFNDDGDLVNQTISTTAQGNDSVQVQAYDRSKVTLKILKEIYSGEWELGTRDKWEITFNLYSDQERTNLVGTVTINSNTDQGTGITFKLPSDRTRDAMLSLGETYYLEEVVTAPVPTDHFVLTSIKKDGTEMTEVTITTETSGNTTKYIILPGFGMDEVEGFVLTAVNNWMFGQADFKKVDKDDPTKMLPGGKFEVRYYDSEADDWVLLPGSSVTEIKSGGQGTGQYTATIPLISAEATTYRIYETRSPEGYLLPPDWYIEVELSLEDNIKTIADGLVMTNTEGDELKIYKYDNVYGATSLHYDTSKTTRFAVFHKVNGVWENEGSGYTDETGVYVFDGLLVPGDQYGIAEVAFSTSRYNRLFGIYQGDTKLNADGQIEFEGKMYDFYVITAGEGAVTLRAYNVPNVKPRIEKIDIGKYEGKPDPNAVPDTGTVGTNENVKAKMHFAIYEITRDDTELYALTGEDQPTAEQVEAFLALGRTPVYESKTDSVDPNLKNGSYNVWDQPDVADRWDNSKSYLLVETYVTTKDDATYDTMRKDDPEVRWFYRTPIVPDEDLNDPDKPVVWQLKNKYGEAYPTLSKFTEVNQDQYQPSDVSPQDEDGKRWVDSLLTDDRHAVYYLGPGLKTQINQMLDSYVLWESGIKAYGYEIIFAEDGTIAQKNLVPVEMGYTFDKIVVGSASHTEISTVDAYYDLTLNSRIDALVTFYSDLYTGGEMDPSTVLGSVVLTDMSSPKTLLKDTDYPAETKSFSISYYCPDLRAKTVEKTGVEYSLGEHFKPTATFVYVTALQQEDGTAENPVIEVDHFTNDADVVLTYPKWADDGSGTSIKERTVHKDHTLYVKTVEIPRVSIEKGVDPSPTITLDGTATYTLKISNSSGSPVPFIDPVVLDILPTGVSYVNYSAWVSRSEGIEAGQIPELKLVDIITGEVSTSVDDAGETISGGGMALFFKLEGSIPPGAWIQIEYKAIVERGAGSFADVINGDKVLCNDAYLSSSHTVYHTALNPYGISFQDDTGRYGVPLDEAIRHILSDSPSAGTREGKVDSELGRKGYLDPRYGWIPATKPVNINLQSQIKLAKAVWGDRDAESWHEKGIGVISRTNYAAVSDYTGWANWRLSVTNGYSDDRMLYNLQLGDVLPNPGDYVQYFRESHFEMDWGEIFLVRMNDDDISPDDYDVYFFVGETPDALAALLSAMDDGDPAAHGFWLEGDTEHITEDSKITAFLVKFHDNIVMPRGSSLLLAYRTYEPNIEDNAEFAPIAFTTDDNYFLFHHRDYEEALQSNTVTITLNDTPVQIQGDLWIDEDWDGVQGTGNHRNYMDYLIVQQLAQNLKFYITDKRDKSTMILDDNDTGDMTQWDGYNGTDPYDGGSSDEAMSESIKHFAFGGLGASAIKNDVTDESEIYVNGELDKTRLKGQDPYRYILTAKLTDDEEGTLAKIFQISSLGEYHYVSDNPDGEHFTESANYLDNNFYAVGKKAAGNEYEYETKQFFIRSSSNVDQSKDIAFRMVRELEIIKVAEDNIDLPIEGATFKIYGPFEEGEGTAIDASKLLDTVTTDAEGKAVVTGLNWWKEYVIEEVEAGPGYDKDGIKAWAPASSGTVISMNEDGSFRLHLPSTEKVDATEHAMVSNPRYVKIPLQVEKILNTYSDKDYTFEYELRLDSITPAEGFHPAEDGTTMEDLEPNKTLLAQDPIETISITVTGSKTTGQAKNTGKFTAVEVNGPGTYVFSIKEIAPDPLPSGWTYDPQLTKTATVTIVWDETEQKLVIDGDIVYSDPITEGDETYEKFTNSYEATGEWIPNVLKELTGRPLVAEEFTFELRDEEGNLIATGTNDADGNVTFTPEKIEYTLADVGTHTYTITEVEGTADGVTYSTQVVTATVVVSDNGDGTLKVEATYSPEDKTFINDFEAHGEFTPIAFKVLNGRDFNENEVFTLTLTDEEGNVVATGTVSGGSNGQPAQFTFDPEKLTYDHTDLGPNFSPVTFTYTLTETKGTAGGVIYSEEQYTVHVTISLHQNEDGTYSSILDVEDDMPEDGYYFTNTYETIPAALTPEAKKSMEGEPIPEPMTFDFVMTLKSQKDADGDNITDAAYLTNDPDTFIKVGDNWTKSVTIPKNGTTGSVSFDEITYTKTGTYVFEIVETPGTNTHIDYDPAVWTYTVVVTDDKEGNLVAVDDYRLNGGSAQSGPAEFVNTYTPTPTTEKVKAQKILTGHPLYDAEHTVFKFQLSFLQANVANGCIMPENTIVEILGSDAEAGNENSIKWFDEITFTKAGVYQFLIEEIRGDNPKITYDPQKWVATITVTDMLGNLAVTAGPTYKNQATSDQADWAIFTNNYNPDDTYLQPQVDKELIQAFGPTVEDKEFTFKLTPDPNNPVDDEGNPGAIIPAGGDVTTLTIPAGSTAHHIALFGQIRFTVAGTYIFTITEDEGTDAHIGYDPAEWTLTVVIIDNDGELEVDTDNTGYDKGSGSNPESAMIENNYVPEPTYLQPGLDKTVTNEFGPTVEDKIFYFKLTLKSQKNAAGEDMEGGVNIPAGGDRATLFIPAGATNATTHFGILEFVKAGTFVFEVTEDKEDEEGITYDETVWTLTVVIVDNDGVLAVESADYSDGDHADPEMAHFTNPYVPEPTHYQPKVTKVIAIDYGPTVREKVFNFELTLLTQVNAAGETITGGVIIPDGGDKATITIPAGGTTDTALLGNLEFVKAGTYTFKIVETAENEEGITYDAAEWTLTVVIRDTDGVLVVESYAYEKDGEIVEHSEATFDEDGKLVEEVEDTVIGAEFTNPYKPEPTNYQPKVTKVIEIDYGPIVREKIFNFELTLLTQVDAAGDPITDGAVIPAGGDHVTITIPAGGTTDIGLFGNIRFDKAGTYTFKIVETAENEEGITYDAAEWTLTVVIRDTDNELEVESYTYEKDGQVVAHSEATFDPETLKLVTPVEDTVIGAEFTNPYKPEPTYYQPKVTKVIEIDYGPIVREKIFHFELTLLTQVDAAGDPITDGAIIPEGGDHVTITIPAGGTTDIGLFGNIRFDKAGTYTFKIVETAEDEEGITYDAAEWTLTVVIRDTDNELEVESYTYEKDGQVVAHSEATFDPETLKLVTPVEDVVIGAEFINPYVPEPTHYQPKVTKVIEIDYGPIVREKIFNFELTLLKQLDAAGDPIEGGVIIPDGGDHATVTIPAGGTTDIALFGDLEFVKAGTYTFQIVETAEDEEGITYDAAVWTLTVVIRDTDNELEVESYTYEKDGEVVAHSEATFDEVTGKLVEPVEDTVIGAEFINPYKPEPTYYQPMVTKVIEIDYGPTVREKIFNFELTLLTQVDAAGDPIEDGAVIPAGGDHVTITIPAGGTTDIGLFGNIRFDKAGTYTFKIVETAEDEEGITYDAAEWTLTVVIRDTDHELQVESYTYEKDGEVVAHSEATFDEVTGKLVEPVEDTVIGAEFTNPYKPEPTNYQPMVTKVIEIDYGPTVREKIFNFELTLLTQVDAAGDPIEDGAVIPEGGDRVTITIPAGGTTDIGLFGDIRFDKAGTYTFKIVETAEDEEGITYDAAEWTLTVVIRDTDHELEVESYTYEKDGEIVAHSEAVFDEETGKLVEPVEDTVIGAEFINPYKPEPTNYQPMVTKVIELGYGPTVEEKVFHFVLTLLDQVDAAGDPMEDGAIIPEGGDHVTITIPAGGTTDIGLFGDIEFVKAGTYTFQINETAEDEEGITYDAGIWTLTVVIRDTDPELEVESYAYEKDGEIVEHSEAVFDEETGKLVEPVEDTAIGAEFINPYKPEPTEYAAKVMKTVIGEPTVEDKYFHFSLEASDENPAGASLTSSDDAMIVEIRVPAGTTGAGVEAFFDTITFDQAGTFVFTITELLEDEEGITYDGTVWTLTVVVTDTDGVLEILDEPQCEAEDKDPSLLAFFENPYAPSPTCAIPRVTKMLAGQTPSEDTTFKFVLKAVSVVEGGSRVRGQEVTAGTTWTKTIVGAGTVDFDQIKYTKAGTYTYTITETDTHANGWTYSAVVWTVTVTVTDTDGALICTTVYTAGEETGTTAEFVNYYEPNPVEWTPEVQKVLSEDSDLPRTDVAFHFELKYTEGDPEEDGCSLTAEDVLTAETILAAGDFESIPVAFDTITFTKAGTYTFEVTELDDGLLGYTYDTTPKTLTVTVLDISGDLVVHSVTIDGGEADIDGALVTVIVTNEFEEPRTEVSGIKTWVGDEYEEHVRPVSITVRLYADGVEVGHVVVTKEDDWKFAFTELLKYNTDGTEIVYTISEDEVLGYITDYSGYNITNRRIPDTGDDPVLPWAIALGASTAALGGVLLLTKKKRKEDEEEA